jgi:hypothetical protein
MQADLAAAARSHSDELLKELDRDLKEVGFSDPFLAPKHIRYDKGPADGLTRSLDKMPPDGIITFFAESSPGNIEQAVYKLTLKANEQTPEEKESHAPLKYEWVAEYVGKRRYRAPLQGMISGIRKGS